MAYGEAGRAMGVEPNSLRYGATTGRLRIRWEGARQPLVWTVPTPDITPEEARAELVRRFLHLFAPSNPATFVHWAGLRAKRAADEFDRLGSEIIAVHTPIGEAWILAKDESTFGKPAATPAPARLLPSGDTYWMRWGADRELILPDPKQRSELWTPRVWPGAVLVGGEIVGTWRRANAVVDITPWRRLSKSETEAVESEALSFPIPGLVGQIKVKWLQ
jgi:hypothetical protein